MEGNDPVFSYVLRKSYEKRDWEEVNRLCSSNENSLNTSEASYWIRSLYMMGNYSLCSKKSQGLLIEDSGNLVALKFGARARTKLALDNSEIKTSWETLLKHDPENLEALNNLARVSIREGMLSEAKEKISELLEINSAYAPGINTLDKIKRLMKENKGMDFQNEELSYSQLYRDGRFSELIDYLGGLESASRWTEDEATFAFRALSKSNKTNEIFGLAEKLSEDVRKSPRIISEIASAAREFGELDILNESMKELSMISEKNYMAAKHYLRQVIYFNEENYALNEIESILLNHGEKIIPYLVRLILKSSRYSLFSEIEGLGGARNLLDPIYGSLRNKIGDKEFNSIFSEFGENFSEAIILDPVATFSSSEPFFQSCLEWDLLHLIPKEYLTSSEKNFPNFKLSEISKEILENLCSSVLPHSFELKEKDADHTIYCTNSARRKDIISTSPTFSLLSVKIGKNNSLISKISTINQSILEEESQPIPLSDPRESLGRIFHLLKGLPSIDKLVISWLSQKIFLISPSEVWYDESLPHGKLAAKINGYQESEIRQITL